MRVYFNSEYPVAVHRVTICPANDKDTLGGQPPSSDWLESDGKTHKTFNLEFIKGVADVHDHLVPYLEACGMIKRSKLILPPTGLVMPPRTRKPRKQKD